MLRFLTLFLGFTIAVYAQNDNRWQDHFSYKNVTNIEEINGIIYCSSENGIFTYDPLSGEVQKNSKVQDLNEVGITAMEYSSETGFLIIGYESGELDFLGEDENYNFLEVPLDDFQGDKQINHIYAYENTAVLSGEFGVVTFSLERLEFDETAFFNDGTGFITVNESAVVDGIIYAATESGIFTHPLNDFIPNFGAWEQPADLPTTNFTQIETFDNNVVAVTGSTVSRFNGTDWGVFAIHSGIQDLKVSQGVLNVVRTSSVEQYDNSLLSSGSIATDEDLNTAYATASNLFLGTNGNGLVSRNTQEAIFPDGPFSNNSFSIAAFNGQVFIAPGGNSNYLNPNGNAEGYFHFNSQEWIHNSTAELLNTRDIVHIAINPSDSTEIWASSWNFSNSGILKVKSGVLEQRFDKDNSALREFTLVGGSAFDADGNLWAVQSFVQPGSVNGLVKFTPDGNSEFVDLTAIENGGGGVFPPVIDRNDYIYVPGTRGDGLQVTNGVDFYSVNTQVGEGSLPSDRVLNLALDQNNILWIATAEGLRIFRNRISELESGQYDTDAIVIQENGIGEELFRDTLLTDVEVDGANRKWISTTGSGVFYISDDGQQTIFNFTTSNSPLPSNNVFDVEVDMQTGRVYFATDKGAVSFQSDAIDTGDSFGDVLAYPNPVRPGFNGNVSIRGLAQNADVRIVDVVGNLMFRGNAEGGVLQWDQTNLQGTRVASGIYLVLMTNSDGTETATTKIAIVR